MESKDNDIIVRKIRAKI